MTVITTLNAAASRDRTDPADRALPFNQVSRGSRSGELSSAQQFESFVLQSFIEPMLPKNDGGFYGEGTAAGIWKSMLAERIGAEMAASGGIGIAQMVEKHHPAETPAQSGGLAKATNDLAKAAAAQKGAALGKAGAR